MLDVEGRKDDSSLVYHLQHPHLHVNRRLHPLPILIALFLALPRLSQPHTSDLPVRQATTWLYFGTSKTDPSCNLPMRPSISDLPPHHHSHKSCSLATLSMDTWCLKLVSHSKTKRASKHTTIFCWHVHSMDIMHHTPEIAANSLHPSRNRVTRIHAIA